MSGNEQTRNVEASLHIGNTLRLETARLILREWSPDDIPDIIEGLNDLNVSKWLASVPHPYTQQDA